MAQSQSSACLANIDRQLVILYDLIVYQARDPSCWIVSLPIQTVAELQKHIHKLRSTLARGARFVGFKCNVGMCASLITDATFPHSCGNVVAELNIN
eukprot:scaffold228383_cov18-Prasinocladus_malaysianus.AAC.1